MTSDTADLARVAESLEALRREVARLGERVAALEAAAGVQSRPTAPSPDERIGDEVILVISAAIAAFLGKRPRIRQIRLLRSDAWAQQGRVTIQASHRLPVHHG